MDAALSSLFDRPARIGRPLGSADRAPRRQRSDAHLVASYLSNHFCNSQETGWLSTMRAARALLPKCTATKSNGERCGFHAQTKNGLTTCYKHTPPSIQAEADKKSLQRCLITINRCASPTIVLRARRQILAIEKRALIREWSHNPTDQGQTLHLHPGDEQAVLNELSNAGVDFESMEILPKFKNDMRWLSYRYLRDHISKRQFDIRLRRLIEVNDKWQIKLSSHSQL